MENRQFLTGAILTDLNLFKKVETKANDRR